MRVVCDRRDQDLLFLSQGMLSAWRQVLTVFHLKRCTACQKRVEEFAHTSRELRLALGAAPAVRPMPRRMPRLALATALLILLAALGLGTYAVFVKPEPPPPAVAPAADNCDTKRAFKKAAWEAMEKAKKQQTVPAQKGDIRGGQAEVLPVK